MARLALHVVAGIAWLGGVSCVCLPGCGPLPGVAGLASKSDRSSQLETATSIPDPFVIELTGTEHRWQARYPEIGGAVAVVRDLQNGPNFPVPCDTDVVLVLKSTDFIYTLAIPELGLKQVAVPDLEFRMSFRPIRGGRYSLIGDELCGLKSSDQLVHLVAEPRTQLLQFLTRSQRQDDSLPSP
jgi:heme/copper-type cytochrome/quinol oxidase subunit 2